MSLSKNASTLWAIIGNFVAFATSCLKIVNKEAQVVPLVLNRAQLHLHSMLEDQKQRKGFVRMYVLKGRQQGISTYIAARFFWRAITSWGIRIAIMTHLDEATENLFGMVKHYLDHLPKAIKPATEKDAAKALSFAALHTKYRVTTAGSRGTGRSATAQFFHGSEVAFWPHADLHMAGIGQIVPMSPDTEVILESTANGIGNRYHKGVMNALKGTGDYELCFIPWFWQTEYARPVPADVVFEPDELEYQEAYGITAEQLYWRRLKIEDDFSGDFTLFDQEYPATPAIAFYAGTSKALIKPHTVAAAIQRASMPDTDKAALILGVDPAEYGDDVTALVLRRGRKVLRLWGYSGEGNAQIAARIAMLVERQKRIRDPIDAIVVDVTGVGTGVESILTDIHGVENVYRIHNGGEAIEKEKYVNRGSEGWAHVSEWLTDKAMPVSLPARDDKHSGKWVVVLEAELSSREYDYDGRRRVRLESKERMRNVRGVASPNFADALALTFNISIAPSGLRERGETLREKLLSMHRNSRNGGIPGMSR